MDIPVFAAASMDDATVNAESIVEFMSRARHPLSKLVLYSTEPGKFSSRFPAEKFELVNSIIPAQRILSSAHTAIVMSPDDEHYGERGDYSNCIHYYPDDMEKYQACLKNPDQDLQGEVTERNLEAGILRRLMYNPNFAALKVSMQQFLDRLQ